jgi:ankyrin repeat protein
VSHADDFVRLACLTYDRDQPSRRGQARALLDAHPEIRAQSIFTAATVGDAALVRQMLAAEPGLVNRKGGPQDWEPLLYAAYSRVDTGDAKDSTLEVARLLLAHGANPNARFWEDQTPAFTALTGAFGEGEAGPTNQPEHPHCRQLARALLEAGADPNDGQALYNRMFTGGVQHLELLFEFGLSKGLEEQLGWAAQHGHMERVRLLVAHGVDVHSADTRWKKAPYELAMLSGNAEIAEYLAAHGARRAELGDVDAFAAACMAADAAGAKALIAKDPVLPAGLGHRRAQLLNDAASADRRDAVRLMVELGFDVNAVQRTTALHQAAWSGHVEMVKLLLALGADPTLRDLDHHATPLDWARYNHQAGTTAALERR